MRSVASLGARWPQHGKIKFGERTEKAMRALKTWRFMSPDRKAIEIIAGVYGGQVRPLHDPLANPNDQWQVTTEASAVRVYLPRGAYSVWYELWTKGARLRQCDGEDCQVRTQTPDGYDMDTVPCLCNERGVAQCKPKLRLDLMIPDVPFAGCWRFETSSWNAADAVPKMVDLIEQLQAAGIAEAELYLTPGSKLKSGKKTHFVVPGLRTTVTIDQLIAGDASRAALGRAQEAVAELVSGIADRPDIADGWTDLDDEVVDAEIVDDDEGEPVDEDQMVIGMFDAIAFNMGFPVDGLTLLLKVASSLAGSEVSQLSEIPEPTWIRVKEAAHGIQSGTVRMEVAPSGVKLFRITG